jgi:hypothetical protein
MMTMPGVIDPETMNVDRLPGIWSPVQWDLSEDERLSELEAQATASLIHAVDVPEAILRLLLGETQIQRAFEPPKGYDSEMQGEWNSELVTFEFERPIQLVKVERQRDLLIIEYDFKELGRWVFEIEPEAVHLRRV